MASHSWIPSNPPNRNRKRERLRQIFSCPRQARNRSPLPWSAMSAKGPSSFHVTPLPHFPHPNSHSRTTPRGSYLIGRFSVILRPSPSGKRGTVHGTIRQSYSSARASKMFADMARGGSIPRYCTCTTSSFFPNSFQERGAVAENRSGSVAVPLRRVRADGFPEAGRERLLPHHHRNQHPPVRPPLSSPLHSSKSPPSVFECWIPGLA